MNPGALVLLLLGYGLALPTGAKLSSVSLAKLRIATIGHQTGVLLAALGWAVRPSVPMALLHALWAVLARLYMNWRLKKPDQL